MTELKFYTDGDKVYLNNDKGITKEVDLSALFGGGGGGGSGETLIFNLLLDDDTGMLYSNITAGEIVNAINAHQQVIGVFDNPDAEDGYIEYYYFGLFQGDSNALSFMTTGSIENGSPTYFTYESLDSPIVQTLG